MDKVYIPDPQLSKCSACSFVWDDCNASPSVWCRLGKDPEECEGPKEIEG